MPRYARLASLAGLVLATFAVLPGAAPAGRAPVVTRSAGAYPTPAPGAAGGAPPADFRSARDYPVVAVPVRLRIPALRVDTALHRLGLRPDGSIAVPASPEVAGWYASGPRPGQAGPAVILGHVDSRTGPGVFARLADAKAGTAVRIDRADGTTVQFRLTGVSRVAKAAFPTDDVYAPTLDPTLRLVTCGGSFDHARGSYRDNVIAYADRA